MRNINNFYRNKKVFITGHTGFKGTWLANILIHMGAEVTGYSDYIQEHSLYDITGTSLKMNSIIADIRNLDDLKNAIKKSEPAQNDDGEHDVAAEFCDGDDHEEARERFAHDAGDHGQRCFQFVRDVGDEVLTHRLHAFKLGDVPRHQQFLLCPIGDNL